MSTPRRAEFPIVQSSGVVTLHLYAEREVMAKDDAGLPVVSVIRVNIGSIKVPKGPVVVTAEWRQRL